MRQESTLRLLDSIWHMVAEQRQQRRAKAQARCDSQGMNGFTEFATNLLLDNLAFADRCNVVFTSNNEEFVEARVLNPQSPGSTFGADARRMFLVSFAPRNSPLFWVDSCTCGRWRDMKFPCAHACAVMRAAKIDIKSKIDERWMNWTTGAIYDQPMHPVLLEDLPESDILPLLYYRQKGPVRKKRMEAGKYYNPVSLTGATQGCSGCGEARHNITTCWFREANVDEALAVS